MSILSTKLKSRLVSGKPCIGSWIMLGHPGVAEIMAEVGFHWIAVDIEHTAIDYAALENLVRVIGLKGVAPLVRLTAMDDNQIKRVMDAGAQGVIVPMVKTADEARAAVDAVHYPPVGRRSVALGRAQGYGATFENYRSWLAENAFVAVQIEHKDAVENVREILSVPGVDAYLVGPYDLSASMGYMGQPDHPEVLSAIDYVQRVATELGVPGGKHIVEPDPAVLKAQIEGGARFMAYGIDTRFLDVGCRSALDCLETN